MPLHGVGQCYSSSSSSSVLHSETFALDSAHYKLININIDKYNIIMLSLLGISFILIFAIICNAIVKFPEN